MKSKLLTSSFLLLASCCQLLATPSSVFWTNCTTDVYAKDTYHVDVDNYFSVCNHGKNGHAFAPDFGVSRGFYLGNDLNAEVGLDYLGGKSNPFLLNGKIGIEQGKLFTNSPSLSVGFFSIGTTRHRNKSVFDAIIGYTFPDDFGRAFVGVYQGRHSLGKNRSGFMVAFIRTLQKAKDAAGVEYAKWQVRTDVASGKNSIGGAGFGLSYYFTPKINVITGPVIFNDTHRNGRWKWSIQVDFAID